MTTYLISRSTVVSALVLCWWAAPAPAAPVVIDDFTAGEGHFTSPVGASPTTVGLLAATSTVDHDPAVGHSAPGSQRVFIDDDPENDYRGDTAPWRFRNLSGGGTPDNNVILPSTGFVGYWLRTTTPGLRASILIDDSIAGMSDFGDLRDVISDGQWHLYEWDLDAPAEWLNFSGGTAGLDGPTVTIDAVYFYHAGDPPGDFDATFWIDDLSHNPAGSLIPEPTSLPLLVLSALALFAGSRHRRGEGSKVAAALVAGVLASSQVWRV